MLRHKLSRSRPNCRFCQFDYTLFLHFYRLLVGSYYDLPCIHEGYQTLCVVGVGVSYSLSLSDVAGMLFGASLYATT